MTTGDHDQLLSLVPGFDEAVAEWEQTACIHPGMAAFECRLGWRFMHSLYDELEAGPRRAYEVLLANIPQWNGSWFMTPHDAETALDELGTFEATHASMCMDRLVSPDTGQSVQVRHSESLAYVSNSLIDGEPVQAGLVRGQFGVWPYDDPARPLFEATAVEQSLLPAGGVELRATETGTWITLRDALWDGAKRLEVITLDLSASHRYPALGEITALCKASVRTGHHIIWG